MIHMTEKQLRRLKKKQAERQQQKAASQPFAGELMDCALCDAQHRSDPHVESGWTIIPLDGVNYYICPKHFPDGPATSQAWSDAYVGIITQLADNAPFTSSHRLPFEVAPWQPDARMAELLGIDLANDGWMLFRIGTCDGQWRDAGDAYEILSVINSRPGNGHFDDVLEWFEHSCRRDGKRLRIREVENERLKRHLVEKRGFRPEGEDDVVKEFRIYRF